MHKMTTMFGSLAIALCGAAGASAAQTYELITNGGFETGDFQGWTVARMDGSQGDWFVAAGTATPQFGLSSVGPASGEWYAISDQSGPGAQSLMQTFNVPIDAVHVQVSYRMFINDWSRNGPIVGPGLGFAVFDEAAASILRNQHARVDLMVAGGDPFGVDSPPVMFNGFLGIDTGEPPIGWTQRTFNITPYVTRGGVYRLRFAQVDNLGNFNMGIDDVSITASVPEPATWASMMVGGLALVAACRRQRRSPGVVRQPTFAA